MSLTLFIRKYRFALLAALLLLTVMLGGIVPEIIASAQNREIRENQHEIMRSLKFRQHLKLFEDNVRLMDDIQYALLDGYDSLQEKEYYHHLLLAEEKLKQAETICTDSLEYMLTRISDSFSEMKAYGKSIILMTESNETSEIFPRRADNACEKYCSSIFSAISRLNITEENTSFGRMQSILKITEKNDLLKNIRLTAIFIAVCLIIFISILYNRSLKVRINELNDARRKAEETLQLKEQFVTHISHEIRTPLNALLGFADLLSATALTQKQRRQLEALRRSGESLHQVINDVLDYSKMEAGMMQKAEVVFVVREQAAHVQTMFLPLTAEKRIDLDLNIDKNVPRKVKGDPGHLRQILINLVSNAIKFTHEGKVDIHVRAGNTDEHKCWLSFEVSDTGIGIPASQHQEIFRRFYQAVPRHDGQYSGTGLGLSIVRKLTELMGGNVAVSSRVGEGTSFTVSLPFQTIDEEQLPAAADVPTYKHLLIAEDHPLGRQFIQAILEDKVWQYDLVKRGDEAVELLKLNTYELVLLDYNLPEMNGEEITRFIRQTLHLQIPVIGISAGAEAEIARGKEAGMNEFLTKPFTPAQLTELINRYIPAGHIENNDRITNLSYLHKLSNGNQEFVQKMIRQFITENAQEAEELRHALHNESFSEILQVIHRMRTTIAFVGLDVAALPLINEIEKTPPEQVNQPGFKELVNNLIAVCRRAADELPQS
ncbi:MAG: ATP-binding protein [Bacteroidia bacterium]|jgi:signal transduction histidine kinase/DNA-binding response OmpR family regulator|nr:ATP-binding protein [Bacteroidia bacterium]